MKELFTHELQSNENQYKEILDYMPNAVIITQETKIVFANNEACSLCGLDKSKLIGKDLCRFITKKYKKNLHKRIEETVKCKKLKVINDYEFRSSNGEILYLQIT